MTRLLKQSVHQFALSVNAKSMTTFHITIANIWQQQFTVADLDSAYSALYEANIDLTAIDSLDLEFSASDELEQNTVLVVSGTYTAQSWQLHFKQRFTQSVLRSNP